MKLPKFENVKEYIECDGFCPFCKSNNIASFGDFDFDVSIAWRSVECHDCGEEWQDEYSLDGISVRTEEGDRIHLPSDFKDIEGEQVNEDTDPTVRNA